MDKYESRAVIEAAGGDTAFAKLLGIGEDRYAAQRVNNWKRRGIPSDVVLEHLPTIRELQARAGSVSSAHRAG
jgi:hypothetical protein